MRDVTGPISIGVGSSGRQRRPPEALSTNTVDRVGAVDSQMADREIRPAGVTNALDNAAVVEGVPERVPGICRNISFNGIYAVVSKPYQIPDAVVTSAYNPGEVFSCIALNGVAPGVLENIRLADVHVIFPGGGTTDQGANRAVPEIADEYFRNGILPSYALFARNVRGLTLSNVRFEMAAPDSRPAVIFDHVLDAAVNGLNVQGQKTAESVLRFIQSRDVLMSATRLLTETAVFLQVEGSQNQNVVIDGGDFSKADQMIVYRDGAVEGTVKLRT